MDDSATPADVTAIVVNWNSAPLCIELFESLAESFASGLRAVVVDNGSNDDSVGVLERYFETAPHREQFRVVRLPENLGFTGGVNAGTDAALAPGEPPRYIWLCNPDMTLTAGTLPELLAVAAESGAQIVTTGREYLKLDAWPRPFYAWKRSGHWAAMPDRRWWPVGAYFGTCVLFESDFVRRLIQADGHFQDPGLFMDWDEWECTLRARRLNALIVMSRNARFITSTTFRTLGPSKRAHLRQYYAARNAILVGRRNMPAAQFWRLLPVRLARDATWFARVGVRGQRPHLLAYLEGAVDGLRGRTGRWRKHPPSAPVESNVVEGPRPMGAGDANR